MWDTAYQLEGGGETAGIIISEWPSPPPPTPTAEWLLTSM